MTRLAISRCKNGSDVILRFEENYENAGGRLELLANTFIELSFVIKTFVSPIFEWPFTTGITVVS